MPIKGVEDKGDRIAQQQQQQGPKEGTSPTTKDTLDIGGAQFTRQATGLVFEMDVADGFDAADLAHAVSRERGFAYDNAGRVVAESTGFGQSVTVEPRGRNLVLRVGTMPGTEPSAEVRKAVATAYKLVEGFRA